jgi:hypothetical protein
MAAAVIYVLPLVISVALWYAGETQPDDWRTARRDSAGLAPPAAVTHEAVIQAYAAPAVRWRGALGVHTWIAAKAQGESEYTRFYVMGFGVAGGRSALRVETGVPDGYWHGNKPELIGEVRGGNEVDRLIERLHAAARDYPYDRVYRLWPGPNSNTFIASLGRAVPELSIDLPPTAVGKDYLPGGRLIGRPASGSGFQLSLFGLFGLILSPQEGIELNLIGLSAGIDFNPLAIKLPGLGRLGF